MANNGEGDEKATKRKKGTVEIIEQRSVNLETEDEILGDCKYIGKAPDVLEAVKENLKAHGENRVRVTIEVELTESSK